MRAFCCVTGDLGGGDSVNNFGVAHTTTITEHPSTRRARTIGFDLSGGPVRCRHGFLQIRAYL